MKNAIVFLLMAAMLFCVGCKGGQTAWTTADSSHAQYSEELTSSITDKAAELGEKEIAELLAQLSEPAELSVCVDAFSSFTAEDGSAFAVKQYRVDQCNLPFYTEIYYIENGRINELCGFAFADEGYVQGLVRGDDLLYLGVGNSIRYIDKNGQTAELVPILQRAENEKYLPLSCAVDGNIINVSYDLLPTDGGRKKVTYSIDCAGKKVEDIAVEEFPASISSVSDTEGSAPAEPDNTAAEQDYFWQQDNTLLNAEPIDKSLDCDGIILDRAASLQTLMSSYLSYDKNSLAFELGEYRSTGGEAGAS